MPTCCYYYDALDRLAARTDSAQVTTRHFYQANRLASAIAKDRQRTILATAGQLLAQQDRTAAGERSHLLATDQQDSVLMAASPGQRTDIAYSPYGHRHDPGPLPGFNGQEGDPLTGHYLLGNGYRAYNPVLMRFNSPDSLSPFGDGGLNVYAYCQSDPVNRQDPSGHSDLSRKLGDLLPYFTLAASLAGIGFLYKSTKARFHKVRHRTATKPDVVSVAGAVGVGASGLLAAGGSIARIVDPNSDTGYALISVGALAAIGFVGVRYAGYKLGKPAPVPELIGMARRSSNTPTASNTVTPAAIIRSE